MTEQDVNVQVDVDADVAIVGCGPVGGVLATLLGQRGHRVVVFERHPSPYVLPRAVHFDHEIGRILQACGLGDELGAISEPGGEYEWRNGEGEVLLRFGGREAGPCGWPDSSMFWQPALERLIEGAALAQPTVDIRRGTNVVGLVDHGNHVSLDIRTSDDADGTALEPSTLTARYVIGCDGANSTVRDLVGTTVTDLGFFYDWLIVDVALTVPRVFFPVNVQICEPTRPTTAVSGGPGRRRWEFMRLPHETIDELDDVDRAWQLLEPWDITPANAVLERHAVYRFQARWADRWRTGNVLLAGDAAHLMPPFAGQGMCSGLRDAANLAWKLDAVLTGASGDGLLDHYETERAENVRAVIDFSMELGKIICVTDPVEAAARDELMAGGVEPGVSMEQPPLPGVAGGIIRADDPVGGQLFVQGRVTSGGATRLLDDVVGAGWRLVTTDPAVAASLPTELTDWFAGLGGAVVTLDLTDDVGGTYTRWFGNHGVVAVLQRPDFHLFGAVAEPSAAGALLHDLRAALSSQSSTQSSERLSTPVSGGTS